MSSRLLILWNVEDTLVTTGPVGREIFADAFTEATGVPLRETADPAGLTEPIVFRRTLELHRLADGACASSFPVFAKAQARLYHSRAADLLEQGHVLPGALEALQRIHDRSDIVSTVLTGGTKASATAKLEVFGLDEHLHLRRGAFGEDGPDLAALIDVAWQRNALTFGPQRTVLVGATPHDVAAGQSRGVFVVGVATGRYSEARLRDAGANSVLPALTVFPRVQALIDRGQAA